MAAAARAGARPAAQPAAPAGADSKSHTAKLIDSIPAQKWVSAAAAAVGSVVGVRQLCQLALRRPA